MLLRSDRIMTMVTSEHTSTKIDTGTREEAEAERELGRDQEIGIEADISILPQDKCARRGITA